MNDGLNFFDRAALLHRLSHALKKRSEEVVFLLGAGLSAPVSAGQPGVLGANGIIELIQSEFADDQIQREEFAKATKVSGSRGYQTAFLFLQGRLGQSVANEVVRRAVLGARLPGLGRTSGEHVSPTADEDCRLLELDSQWALNPGTENVGRLVAHYPHRFGRALLTTNFDPLIEVSIRNAGAQFLRTTLQSDGNLTQTEGPGSHVIHLHGYWYGSDTLHTGRQLQQSRPRLKGSLASLLRSKVFVVCGYGGWDDVFMQSLMEVALDESARPEVLWTFHSESPTIEESLARHLSSGLDRGRVSLYAGVDCNDFFPALYESWCALENPTRSPKAAPTNSVRVSEPLQQEVRSRDLGQRVLEGDDEDRPPIVEFCIGRDEELRQLRESKARVAFVTGIGGQGKSTVAAQYFADCQRARTYDYFVWRDCKEESERFENQLASVVEALSKGKISGEDLAKQSPQSITQLVMTLIGDTSVLFVFDNVDHYVNLELQRMTASPDLFVQAFLSSETRSRVVLTCRPSVKYQHPFALSCHLEGISLDAAHQLFASRKAACSDAEIAEAHELANGHAFWLDLLSIQVAKSPAVTLRHLVGRIRSGGGSLPEETLNSIWATLRDREKLVLRSMAETVRPETEDEIAEYLRSMMHYPKVIKAITALRALNLVVVKKSSSGRDVLELHPLVRRFVRKNFSQIERSSFIEEIIRVYKRFIGSHKMQLTERPTLTTLQYWTQAVELEVAAGKTADAFLILLEVSDAFSASAYAREFSRTVRLLLESTDWVSEHRGYVGFDSIFRTYVVGLAHLGETAEVDKLLEMYEMTVVERDFRYVVYCEMKCHVKWIRGEFSNAVKWGHRGQSLKASSSVDTKFDPSHSLALAERDAGRPELALPVFLSGRSLSEVTNPEELDEHRDGPHYGNIGRCLHFMGQVDLALVCYQKSALLIEKAPQREHVINQGFIRRWIGELLFARKQHKLAGIFLEAARLKWKDVSPTMAAKVTLLQRQLSDELPSLMEIPSADIEGICQQWILGRFLDADLE